MSTMRAEDWHELESLISDLRRELQDIARERKRRRQPGFGRTREAKGRCALGALTMLKRRLLALPAHEGALEA